MTLFDQWLTEIYRIMKNMEDRHCPRVMRIKHIAMHRHEPGCSEMPMQI